MNITLRD